MKKIFLFILLCCSIQVLGQASNPKLEILIMPKYMNGYAGAGRTEVANGLPTVYRARITGLTPFAVYRYQNKVVLADWATPGGGSMYQYILPGANVPAGIPDYNPGDFYQAPVANANTNGSVGDLNGYYGELKADKDGNYTGWFIQETIRYNGADGLFYRILLNEPGATDVGKVAYMIHSPTETPVYTLATFARDNTEEAILYGTAIRSTATKASEKNIILLYDNVEGTGRPISTSYVENDGAGTAAVGSSITGLMPFYYNNVNGVKGAWGSIVINTDAKGIRRIEQRSLTTGEIVGYNTSADGIWPDGTNPGGVVSTVNVNLGTNSAGTVAIVIDGSKVTLEPVKTPQTLSFTNTFPESFKVGDPDFTLSAESTSGLTDFVYSVAAEGVLQVTGNTVKIIGAGTAELIVTQAGNETIAAATATKTIVVDALPQAITGLPASLNAVYGSANIQLTTTGGASNNPVTYTSDDVSIAEVNTSNEILIKKAGAVTIRANQLGNTDYLTAPEVAVNLIIAKASLDVIAADKYKVQGTANPEATFDFGAFKSTDDASSVTGMPVLSIAADETTPAGVYDINVDVSGLTADNYTFNPVKGKLNVEAKLAQILTFTGFPVNASYGSQPLPFQVSSTSANEIIFSSSNPNAAVVAKNNVGEWTVRVVGAGEANITAAQAGDAAYIPGSLTSHIVVDKASLSIIADDKAKLTGEADPVFTARYVGFVNHENIEKLNGTLQFTTQPDGDSFAIIPSGSTARDYIITFVNGRLTVGDIAFAAMNKTYGAPAFNPAAINTDHEVPVYTAVNPSVAIVNGSGLLEIRGAGTTEVKALFPSGATGSTTLTVEKKEVLVTPNAQTRIYAQASPELTVSYDGFVYGENETILSQKPAVSTTAVVTSAAANYAITASAASANNYKFTYQSGLLTVTRALLIVKANDKSKVYGQSNPEFTVHYSGIAAQDADVDLGLGTSVTTIADASSAVNTYPIAVAGAPIVTNYSVTYEPGTLLVTPAPLTIIANNVDRTQGQPNPTFGITYVGFVNGDEASDLTQLPVASTTATIGSGRGTYPITVTGALSSNYTISYKEGQLFIKGLPVLTFADLPAVTYGDADFTPVATSESAAQPVFSSDNLNVAVIENGRVKIVSAGTVNITASFAATADFVEAVATKQLIVEKRKLIVRAENKIRLYGQSNPILTGTYEGFVKGETLTAAVSAPALFTTEATPLSAVGTYAIKGSAGSAQNYSLSYETGILTIDKAVLTVTADHKTRIYGVENPEFTFKYTGFVNAEDASVIQNAALASTEAALTAPAGTYPIVPSGASDENYTFNYVNGILTITATTRTLSMDALPTKYIGDADFTPAVNLSSGETPVFTSADPSIAVIVDNKIHVVSPGTVLITASAPVNSSYSVKPSNSKYLVVSKVSQVITFENVPVLKTDGSTYTLKATASSGLPVTFSVSNPGLVSLNGDLIKAIRLGKVQITATQAGDSRYAAAQIVVKDVISTDAAGVEVKVHPALSINGDGKNDFLSIDGINAFPINKVTIVDRTGLKVFQIDGYDNDQRVFVGKSKSGVLLPQGTYFCLIEYNSDFNVKSKTGYFVLKY